MFAAASIRKWRLLVVILLGSLKHQTSRGSQRKQHRPPSAWGKGKEEREITARMKEEHKNNKTDGNRSCRLIFVVHNNKNVEKKNNRFRAMLLRLLAHGYLLYHTDKWTIEQWIHLMCVWPGFARPGIYWMPLGD